MPETGNPMKLALQDQHLWAGGVMGEQSGWQVPLHYGSAEEEAQEVRRRAGVFDLSHFGRIRIRGDGALDLLEQACTADIGHQEDDTSMPTDIRCEDGDVIDNCRLIRLSSFWVLVSKPQDRTLALRCLSSLASRTKAKVDDQTTKTTMLAVVGPAAESILQAVLPFSISGLAVGEVKFGSLMVARYIAERVDVAGMWGVCVSIPNMVAAQAWRFITKKAGDNSIRPAGMEAWRMLSGGGQQSPTES